MRTSSLSRQAAVAAVAAAVLVLSACGDDSSDSASESPGGGGQAAPSVSADDELAALVPDAIAEDGVITVGSDTTYAPAEFLDADGQTIVGFDVDLFGLVAQKLGLQAEFETASFDSIIAGVGSGQIGRASCRERV